LEAITQVAVAVSLGNDGHDKPPVLWRQEGAVSTEYAGMAMMI
jgi:hypothetical protein